MEKKVWEGMERQDIDPDVATRGGDADSVFLCAHERAGAGVQKV